MRQEALPERTISPAPLEADARPGYVQVRVRAKARKFFVGIVGGLILAIGLAMVVLPGPAFIVIPAGLALLASEFLWARRLKEQCEDKFKEWREEHRRKKAQKRRRAMQAY